MGPTAVNSPNGFWVGTTFARGKRVSVSSRTDFYYHFRKTRRTDKLGPTLGSLAQYGEWITWPPRVVMPPSPTLSTEMMTWMAVTTGGTTGGFQWVRSFGGDVYTCEIVRTNARRDLTLHTFSVLDRELMIKGC
ncbi:hypothetical protein L6164_027214 [Bauhinia variegata]|uniref:Uncharacterized protein n=1 Tax=Bauhinia variegata TaxID=167791 RepID=A0ACB9LSI1_BAUVA|nr:hypothetical protein L6164_027214 [Bauhinia variegata]